MLAAGAALAAGAVLATGAALAAGERLGEVVWAVVGLLLGLLLTWTEGWAGVQAQAAKATAARPRPKGRRVEVVMGITQSWQAKGWMAFAKGGACATLPASLVRTQAPRPGTSFQSITPTV